MLQRSWHHTKSTQNTFSIIRPEILEKLLGKMDTNKSDSPSSGSGGSSSSFQQAIADPNMIQPCAYEPNESDSTQTTRTGWLKHLRVWNQYTSE